MIGTCWPAFVVAVRRDHHFAKVLFVLDPVQFNLEPGELSLLDMAFLQQRVDRSDDVLGAGGSRFALEVVEFNDHVWCVSVSISVLVPRCMQLRLARPFYLIQRLRSGIKQARWKAASLLCTAETSFSIIELHESDIHKHCPLFRAAGADAGFEERGKFQERNRVKDRRGHRRSPAIAAEPGDVEG